MMSSTTGNWDSELIMPNLLHQLDLLERSYAGECGEQQEPSLLDENCKDKDSEANNKKRTSDKKSFQCCICEKLFTRAGSLKRHIETAHDHKTRLYKCDTCEKTFRTKQNVQNHERTHTDERPFNCSYCEKSFVTRSNRYTHELGIHAKDKLHSCLKCGKKFLFPSMLKNHMKTHNGADSYEYSNIETSNSHVNFGNRGELCQISFGEKYFKGLNKTKNNFKSLNDDAGPNYKCFLCQTNFKKLHQLENHWLIHTTEPNLFQFGFENANLEIIEIELLI